jgi:hypothetical protein
MMGRNRPSNHEREREYQKRQRELKRAAQAVTKRERRAQRHEPLAALPDAVQGGKSAPAPPDD